MTPDTPTWHKVAGWLGIVLHAAALYWYAATGLVAPAWAAVVLLGVWAVLAVVAVVALRRRPVLVPLAPVAAAVIWVVAISAGDAFLGWTA